MEVKEQEVQAQGLCLESRLLEKAHLGERVQILITEGEIRILPVEQDALALLDRLEGCLGKESAEDYNFKLKIGQMQRLSIDAIATDDSDFDCIPGSQRYGVLHAEN